MGEVEFTLKSEFTFRVNTDLVSEADSFKEVFEKGHVKVVHSNIKLTEPAGYVLKDDYVLKTIREAILYGLKEKA